MGILKNRINGIENGKTEMNDKPKDTSFKIFKVDNPVLSKYRLRKEKKTSNTNIRKFRGT